VNRKNYSFDSKFKFLSRFRDLAESAFKEINRTDGNLFQHKTKREGKDWDEIETAKVKLVELARTHLGYSKKTMNADIISSLFIAWKKKAKIG